MQKIKKIATISLLLSSLLVLIFSFSLHKSDKAKEQLLLELIKRSIKSYHYIDIQFNNTFSEKVYDLFLKRMDYNKRFFTQEDIDQLNLYKYKIDDDILAGDFTFFNIAEKLYLQRISEVNTYVDAALKRPMSFTKNEDLELDAEKRTFAKNKKVLKKYWEKFFKLVVLEKYAAKLQVREDAEARKDTAFEYKTDKQLEAESRKEVKKTYDDWYHRLNRANRKDVLHMYFNSITGACDPYTSYFPPKNKADFDMSMSGKFEGIGATLSQANAYIKVERIVPGSPCWKQGDLKAGDLILKVGQGAKEPVNVVDMRLDEAIKFIRGKKGTEVRLTVKKTDGSIQVIPIIRDVIVLEETFAKSAVLEDSLKNLRVGYIYLPQFYVDFKNRKTGRSSSVDVKKEILKLEKENIDGLILDLRNNGGGSLDDAIKIVGLFVKSAPVVQVRSRYSNYSKVFKDTDNKVTYDGDLVVLVNEFSASASEITAAAIQDLKRGVIVGSIHTHGKGSVQQFLPFDQMVKTDLKPLGDLKITFQKFYRINGGATQLRGVSSDIVLPDAYAKMDVGEKDLPHRMPWDEIMKTKYKLGDQRFNLEKLKQLSSERVSKNMTFNTIQKYADYLKEIREETLVSLNLKKYRKEQKAKKEESKKYNEITKNPNSLSFSLPQEDAQRAAADTLQKARKDSWFKQMKKDMYIEEACYIIKDMQSNGAKP